jgi:hypothetical protein
VLDGAEDQQFIRKQRSSAIESNVTHVRAEQVDSNGGGNSKYGDDENCTQDAHTLGSKESFFKCTRGNVVSGHQETK